MLLRDHQLMKIGMLLGSLALLLVDLSRKPPRVKIRCRLLGSEATLTRLSLRRWQSPPDCR